MMPPAEEAPPPPKPAGRSWQRTALFLFVTSLSALLMAVHFISIPRTIAAQGGNRLSEAQLTIIDKLILATQCREMRPYIDLVGKHAEGLDTAYDDAISALEAERRKAGSARSAAGEPPVAGTATSSGGQAPTSDLTALADLERRLQNLRARYVIALCALGRETEARDALKPLAALPDGADIARAIQQAFGLDSPSEAIAPKGSPAPADPSPRPASPAPVRSPATARPTPPPLSPAQVTESKKALEEVEGWQGLAARLALARRGHDTADEATLEAALQSQAVGTAAVLGMVALLFLVNFSLGVIVLFIWLLKGRQWNLESTPADPASPSSAAGLDPLVGWSMLCVFQVVSALVGTLISTFLAHQGESVAAHGSVLAVVGVQMIIYAVMLALMGWAVGFRWETIGLHTRRFGRSLLCGLCLYWGAFVVVLCVGWLMTQIFHTPSAQNNPVFKVIEEASSHPGQTVALLTLVAVMGPLFEEILFRGVIYTSMRSVLPAALAIPLNGLLFSAIHGDLNTLVPLATLGMLLAYGFERTRSLATSGICHGLWNGQTFVLFMLMFS